MGRFAPCRSAAAPKRLRSRPRPHLDRFAAEADPDPPSDLSPCWRTSSGLTTGLIGGTMADSIEARPRTLIQDFSAYLTFLRVERASSPHTVSAYSVDLRALIDHVGANRQTDQITANDLREVLAKV